MKIGIVVCNNGYGHIRRQSIIARELINRGNDVVIYAPLCSLGKVSSDLVDYCCDFNTNSSSFDWMQGNARKWVNVIGSLSEFDVVISDNLIDVLTVRPDAIISGSFFWHKILGIPRSLIDGQEKLLLDCEPTIISNEYFSPAYIRSRKNFKPIGFIKKEIAKRCHINRNDKKSVLLTIGAGRSDSETLMKSYITDVLDGLSLNFENFGKIYIESRMYSSRLPKNFVSAKFDENMFDDLDAVIGRPGIGIITECATRNIDYISIRENSNSEMVFNNNILSQHFDAVIVSTFEEGLAFANRRLLGDALLSKASANGLNEFISIVEGIYETS